MDAKTFAEAIVRAGYGFPGQTAVRIDVGTFKPNFVTDMFDEIINLSPSHDLRLKGVRADTSSFNKIGIKQDAQNSGLYKNIRVVIDLKADFDTMEFVLIPTKLR